jgi:hypothetical protein
MPPRRSRRLTRAVAGALAVTAIAAPAAIARPIDAAPGWTASQPGASPSPADAPAPTVIRTIDNGFDWSSAGIGAGATTAIALLSLGGVRASAHAHARPAR